MQNVSPTIAAHLADRGGLVARALFWIVARDRATGDPAPLGLWTGDDHQVFVIGSEGRTYYGAGGLLRMEAMTAETGIAVRRHRVTLSPIAPEVQLAIRGYDPRLARAEIHVAYFSPVSHVLIDAPRRVFSGWVDHVSVVRPAVGREATCEVTLLSSAFALTRSLPLRKSDSALRRRAPADGFRRYADISGAVETAWGELRASAPARSAAPEVEPGTPPSDPHSGHGGGDY